MVFKQVLIHWLMWRHCSEMKFSPKETSRSRLLLKKKLSVRIGTFFLPLFAEPFHPASLCFSPSTRRLAPAPTPRWDTWNTFRQSSASTPQGGATSNSISDHRWEHDQWFCPTGPTTTMAETVSPNGPSWHHTHGQNIPSENGLLR